MLMDGEILKLLFVFQVENNSETSIFLDDNCIVLSAKSVCDMLYEPNGSLGHLARFTKSLVGIRTREEVS